MGIIYKMCCEQCSTTFLHEAGVGMFCSCPECEDQQSESSPFFCPVCNERYVPDSDNFNDSLKEVILWD